MKLAVVVSVRYADGIASLTRAVTGDYYYRASDAARRRRVSLDEARDALANLDADCNFGAARLLTIDDTAVAGVRAAR